ncbi:hypothetical protein FPV67DRAFT_1651842 [Lyophyllum atratum]|nr:hypothetical protein FPV67DRAFT_1651842 [Lyophyllum atratum]
MLQEESKLLSLSTELLLLILEQLASPALIAVSKASRRLHYLALPTYLSRYGIFNPKPTSLVLQGRSIRALPGLRASLSITSFDSLSFKFDGPDEASYTQGVTSLFRLIHRLASVDSVTLQMGNIDARWVDGFATARCRHIWRCDSHLLGRLVCCGSSEALDRPRASSKRAEPFYAWTLRTLNTSDIRSLSIRLSGIVPETWALILPTITIPSLIEFEAETIDIAFPDLILFLSRHPSINTLHLHPHFSHTDSQKRPKRSKKKHLLPRLTSLGGSPSNIAALLAHLSSPPELQSIALSLPMHQRVFQPSDLEQLNKRIAGVMHGIAPPILLALNFSVPCETSASETPAIKGGDIAAVFRSVRTLAFSSDGYFAFAKWVVPVLPTWLANFAALQHVRMANDCVPAEPECRQRLVDSIRARCPGIQMVTFEDEVQRV